MNAAPPILEIEGLTIGFGASADTAVVSDVSLSIRRNEVVGVIGESGSGKTLTALAVLGLLPGRARIFHGDVKLQGNSLLQLSTDARRTLMGDRIAYIPQDAMRSLNPTMRIKRPSTCCAWFIWPSPRSGSSNMPMNIQVECSSAP
jgi:ABC-type glutathione transport system ATPase component